MVINTPAGKMVDLRKMTMTALSAVAHLDKKLRAMQEAA